MTYKNITHRDYNHFKAKYNNTVPIRGRAEDVRPIGERRRSSECITTKKYPCGQVSYCATLYNTDVVEYHNNGQVTLRTNGWQTPSTAEFMHIHSPFSVWKQDNKLWARVQTPEGYKAYPIGESLTFEMVDYESGIHMGRFYRPINTVLINKRVVDRAKAKAAREPLQPFLAWCKAFLTMSDGWLMHETRKAALGWEQRENGGAMYMPLAKSGDRDLYRALDGQMEIIPEDNYLQVLCSMAPEVWRDKRQTESHTYEYSGHKHTYVQNFYDYRIEFDNLKRKIYRMSEQFGDIYTTVQVEPTDKAIGNTV